MAGWTNRAKYMALNLMARGVSPATTFYLALFTATTAPSPDTNLVSDLTQVNVANGYADGGNAVSRDAAGFDVLVEDDTNDRAYVQLADVVFTASGGSLPSGNGARYCALTDDNVTVSDREVYHYGDLGSDLQVSDGQALTIVDFELRINEV